MKEPGSSGIVRELWVGWWRLLISLVTRFGWWNTNARNSSAFWWSVECSALILFPAVTINNIPVSSYCFLLCHREDMVSYFTGSMVVMSRNESWFSFPLIFEDCYCCIILTVMTSFVSILLWMVDFDLNEIFNSVLYPGPCPTISMDCFHKEIIK